MFLQYKFSLKYNKNCLHLFYNVFCFRYLAIDETDRMLERGHFAELKDLLERINLNEKHKKKRQNFIFSATLTIVHDPPSYIKGLIENNNVSNKLNKLLRLILIFLQYLLCREEKEKNHSWAKIARFNQ